MYVRTPYSHRTHSSNIILALLRVCHCFIRADLLLESPHVTSTMISNDLNTRRAKIQVLFKVWGQFSCTFQGKPAFRGLFKTALYFQVLLKPLWTPIMQKSWKEKKIMPKQFIDKLGCHTYNYNVTCEIELTTGNSTKQQDFRFFQASSEDKI